MLTAIQVLYVHRCACLCTLWILDLVFFPLLQIVIGGVFRGSGRQYIGAIMNFIGYYIIGLPLGITLALKVKWGILGLWIGMNFGCAFLVRP